MRHGFLLPFSDFFDGCEFDDDLADALGRKFQLELHVLPFADDGEDAACAPDLVTDAVADLPRTVDGVLLGQVRCYRLGSQDGYALASQYVAGLADRCRRPAVVLFHEAFRDFIEETAGQVRRNAAVHGTRRRIGDVELPFGPGNADIGQTPFFFDLVVIHEGPAVREKAFIEAGQKDHRKFQALSGVERHEGDLRFAAFEFVDVAHEGYRFQEDLEIAFRMAIDLIFGNGKEFAYVFLAAFALRIVGRFGVEHSTVAGLLNDLFHEMQDIPFFGVA